MADKPKHIGLAFEQHFRVKELAELWGMSPKIISRAFEREPGVLRFTNEGTGKRAYATLSIPESIAASVHERLSQVPPLPALASGRAPRVIRFRDSEGRVAKLSREVLKLNRGKKQPRESLRLWPRKKRTADNGQQGTGDSRQ